MYLIVILTAIICLKATEAQYEKDYPDAGLYLSDYRCILDPKITPENFVSYTDEINSIWGSICGDNRGIFVLDPPDGQTYNCGKFPAEWNVSLANLFTAPPDIARNALDQYIQAVYNTSEYQETDCDFNAMTQLVCGREDPWMSAPWYDKIKEPIRAVNIGGLFVLERWIVPDLIPWGSETGIVDQYTFSENCAALNICDILVNHWNTFYTQNDFDQMKALGLNSIRFPVGHWYFTELSKFPSDPYTLPSQSILDPDHPITNIIRYAKNAGLQVIIDLHTAPGSQNGFDNSGQATNMTQPDNWGETWIYNPTNVEGTIQTCGAIAQYINYIEVHFGLDNIMMYELLNEPWEDIDISLIKDFYVRALSLVRAVRPQLPVLMHDSFRGFDWGNLLKNWPFENTFLDTHSYQCFNLWDLASDAPKSDRNKIYAHEMESCAQTIPLHYETCTAVPVFVGEFSIAVDDCMPFLNSRFEDVGQCNNLHLRAGDPYWQSHITSFAMRQIAMFERELGWSFWAWKLSDFAETNNMPSSSYWSFRLASQYGYFNLLNSTAIADACLHSPPDDYMTGGNGIDGTDDGNLDDVSMVADPNYEAPYYSSPPGTNADSIAWVLPLESTVESQKGGQGTSFSGPQTFIIAVITFCLGYFLPNFLHRNFQKVATNSFVEIQPFRQTYQAVSYTQEA